jgi:hypothetical protein
LLKLLSQISISGGKFIVALSQSFGLQGVEDLLIVDGGDEPIGNGTDSFIEVHLSGEGIESGLG